MVKLYEIFRINVPRYKEQNFIANKQVRKKLSHWHLCINLHLAYSIERCIYASISTDGVNRLLETNGSLNLVNNIHNQNYCWLLIWWFRTWLNNTVYNKQQNFKSQNTYYNYLPKECRKLSFWRPEKSYLAQLMTKTDVISPSQLMGKWYDNNLRLPG